MTRFFAIPGLSPGDVVYWHQTYVDQEPELKFGGPDQRLRDKSPWIYLEEYPKLRREIQSVRPEYKPDVNLGCFLHMNMLPDANVVARQVTSLVYDDKFVRMGYRVPDTHATVVYDVPDVDTWLQDLQMMRECFVKHTDRCYLFRRLFPASPGFVVTEIAIP